MVRMRRYVTAAAVFVAADFLIAGAILALTYLGWVTP